jgi:hypothetical protein
VVGPRPPLCTLRPPFEEKKEFPRNFSKKEFPQNLKMVFPPKLSVQQYRPKNTDITPCKQVPESEFNFFSQLTTRSPELIQEFPLGHSQRHISSGDGNLIEPEYIPCRILLGLFAITLFGGV